MAINYLSSLVLYKDEWNKLYLLNFLSTLQRQSLPHPFPSDSNSLTMASYESLCIISLTYSKMLNKML